MDGAPSAPGLRGDKCQKEARNQVGGRDEVQLTAPLALGDVTLTPALKAPRECEPALKSNSRGVNLALPLSHSVSPAQELISLSFSPL